MKLPIIYILLVLIIGCSFSIKHPYRDPASPQRCIDLISYLLNNKGNSYTLIEAREVVDPLTDVDYKKFLLDRPIVWKKFDELKDGRANYYVEGHAYSEAFLNSLPSNHWREGFKSLLEQDAAPKELQAYLDKYYYSLFKAYFPDHNLTDIKNITELINGDLNVLENLSVDELVEKVILAGKFNKNLNNSGNYGGDSSLKMALKYLHNQKEYNFNYNELLEKLEVLLAKKKDIPEYKEYLANWDNILNMRALFEGRNERDASNLLEKFFFNRYTANNEADRVIKETMGRDVPQQVFGTMDATGYQTRYPGLIDLLDYLKLKPNETFTDLGSGYGRVINFLGLTHPKVKARGFELSEGRAAFSKADAATYQLDNVKYVIQDLADQAIPFPKSDVYYMYDPFPDEVLDVVIGRLKEAAKTGKITIVVSSGWSNKILDDLGDAPWLKKVHELRHNDHEKFYVLESL